MQLRSSVLVSIGFILLTACGSEATGDPTPAPAASPQIESPSKADDHPKADTPSAEESAPADPPATADAGAPETAAPIPVTPQIDVMQTVPTGIKVGWYDTPDCDLIVAEMKNGIQSYKEEFSVAGTETSTIDIKPASFPNHDSMQFTYRLRCKKGTQFSAYSNELSAFGPPPP